MSDAATPDACIPAVGGLQRRAKTRLSPPPQTSLHTAAALVTWAHPPASALALAAGLGVAGAVRAAAAAAARGTLAALVARLLLLDLALASARGLLSTRLRGAWAGSAGAVAAADAAAAAVGAVAAARDAALAAADPRVALAVGAALVAVARTAAAVPWGRVALLSYVGAFAAGAASRKCGPAVASITRAARTAAAASPPVTAWRTASLRTKALIIVLTLCTAWRAAPWSARLDALILTLLFIRAAALRPRDADALRARAAPVLASASKTAARFGSRATDFVHRVAPRRGDGGAVPRMKMF